METKQQKNVKIQKIGEF